jgi:GH25 family lysozyme M1 (1,4-beta-N-acetylmuramidase)
MIYGIDISHNNNIKSLHNLVELAGLSFIAYKATQGVSFIDPEFKQRFHDDRQFMPGTLAMAYHFLDSSHPAEQALFFHNTIKSFGYSPGCMIPCVDSEPNPNGFQPTSEETQMFIDEYESISGCRIGCYTGDAYRQSTLTHVSPSYWWIARYGAVPKSSYDIWQNSESRMIDGSPYDFDQYDGTLEQFKAKFLIK